MSKRHYSNLAPGNIVQDKDDVCYLVVGVWHDNLSWIKLGHKDSLDDIMTSMGWDNTCIEQDDFVEVIDDEIYLEG